MPPGPGGLTLSAAVVGSVLGASLALYWTSWPIFSSSVIVRKRSFTRRSIFGSISCAFDGFTGCRDVCALVRRWLEQRPSMTRAERLRSALLRKRFVEGTERSPAYCAFSLSLRSVLKRLATADQAQK